MAKYIVKNTTILHNQASYGIGETIELTDKIQIAKLEEYITPVVDSEEVAIETTTTTTKTTKSNKKSDKSTSIDAASDTTVDTTNTESTSTEGLASDETKQEETNGTEAIQTTTN